VFDYNRKPPESFALGIRFSKELYFQKITLAAVWRTDYKGGRVKKGAS